jgi:hypothetical protein
LYFRRQKTAAVKPTALFLALYILLGACFPRSDFGQLTKIGHLVAHYQKHYLLAQEQSASLSFLDFFKAHFIYPERFHDPIKHDHGNLPLHTLNPSITLSLQPNLPEISASPAVEKQKPSIFVADPDLPEFIRLLFRPPLAA